MSAVTVTEAQSNEEIAKEKEVQRQAAEAEAKVLAGDDIDFVWVASNRVDDQVVINEDDDAHPGGNCFVGGPGVDYCARTPLVDRYLREGLLVETGEPRNPRKIPVVKPRGVLGVGRDVPGTATRLGRQLDPDLIAEGKEKQVQKAQEQAPDTIPVPPQVEMPPAPTEAQSRQSSSRR